MKIIAHRGLKDSFSENSERAIIECINYGIEGIELDLNVSRNKKVIITHTPFTQFWNYNPEASTWLELEKALDLSLGKIDLYLDIKTRRINNAELILKTLSDYIKQSGFQGNIWIQAKNQRILHLAKSMSNTFSTIAFLNINLPGLNGMNRLIKSESIDAINADYRLSTKFIEKIKHKGKLVIAGATKFKGVDTLKNYEQLGVDKLMINSLHELENCKKVILQN